MRKNIVVGNWKMNLFLDTGYQLVSDVLDLLPSEIDTNVVFAPSFIHLDWLINSDLTENSTNISFASQNCSEHEKGSFTGEVSAEMLKSLGVDYVILGHSERRENFNETNSKLRQKVNVALKNDLNIIFCCGESLLQREQEVHFDWIKDQIRESLFHLSENEFQNIVIAYEPIWAIGTGVTASVEKAQEMHCFIRKLILDNYNNDISEDTSILYGGSCNPSNSIDLFSQSDIDGGLIGGASLNAQDFAKIINSF